MGTFREWFDIAVIGLAGWQFLDIVEIAVQWVMV